MEVVRWRRQGPVRTKPSNAKYMPMVEFTKTFIAGLVGVELAPARVVQLGTRQQTSVRRRPYQPWLDGQLRRGDKVNAGAGGLQRVDRIHLRRPSTSPSTSTATCVRRRG